MKILAFAAMLVACFNLSAYRDIFKFKELEIQSVTDCFFMFFLASLRNYPKMSGTCKILHNR